MCGIFGYIGEEDPVKACLSGLKSLEYRGYDSSGLAALSSKGAMLFSKAQGKVSNLEQELSFQRNALSLAIAHVRWATHGKPSKENAHPLFDQHQNVAVVLNGIIENHLEIRNRLKDSLVPFITETDAEVLPHLIAKHYSNNLLQAVFQATQELEGSFAFAAIHKDHSDRIILAARGCPLAIGVSKGGHEVLIASDPNAFAGRSLNVYYLEQDELAVVKRGGVSFYNDRLLPIEKRFFSFDKERTESSKEGYEHYMLKEIFEQRLSIKRAFEGRFDMKLGNAHFEELSPYLDLLTQIKQILIIGCGTSWHAGLLGGLMLEEMTRIPVQVEIASELRYKNPIISKETLVIAISQSGETADTLAAVKEVKLRGATVLAICNVEHSTLHREANCSILLRAGSEICVCSTKAFTSQLTVLSLFSLLMARLRSLDVEQGRAFLEELEHIPAKIEQVLNQADTLQSLAKRYSSYENFFFLGRRYMYPTALEAALKLKEISYLHATAYPAGELKHGPIALIDENLPVVAFCSNKQTVDKIESNLMEVKARGAPILAFTSVGVDRVGGVADDLFVLPTTIDLLASFPASVAGQLFAYFIAKERKREIDQPKNLAKSVTVE